MRHRLPLAVCAALAVSLVTLQPADSLVFGAKLPAADSVPKPTEEQTLLRPFLIGSIGVVENSPADAHLQEIMAKLAAAKEGKPARVYLSPLNYLNAETGDGGSIVITAGTLDYMIKEKALSNDDTVAFIIAHEYAHIFLGHVAKRKNTQDTLKAVSTLAMLAGGIMMGKGNNGVGLTVLAAGAGLGLISNGDLFPSWSREQELAADQAAVDLIVKAGYSPVPVDAFMQALVEADKSQPKKERTAVDKIFGYIGLGEKNDDDHPIPVERAETIKKYIAEKYQSVDVKTHAGEFKKNFGARPVVQLVADAKTLSTGADKIYANDFDGGMAQINTIKSPAVKGCAFYRYSQAVSELRKPKQSPKFVPNLQSAADQPLAINRTYEVLAAVHARNHNWPDSYRSMLVARSRFALDTYSARMWWVAKQANDSDAANWAVSECTKVSEQASKQSCLDVQNGKEPVW